MIDWMIIGIVLAIGMIICTVGEIYQSRVDPIVGMDITTIGLIFFVIAVFLIIINAIPVLFGGM
jgi:hypothetical protein